MKALLVIDMQLGSFRPYTLRYDTCSVIDRINRLAARFRTQGYKVIYIQHDGSAENCFLPDSDDWQLLPELEVMPEDIIVAKIANDSFYRTELGTILRQHSINSLVITGCATDFCVDTTIKSALAKDFAITVAADAHTTANRPHIDAPTVINHYNWLWEDMSPTAHKIQVIPSAAIEV